MKKYFFLIIGFIFSLQAHAFDDEIFLPYDFTQTRYLVIYKNGYFQRYLSAPFGLETAAATQQFYFHVVSSIAKQPLTNELLSQGSQSNRDNVYTVIFVSPDSYRHVYIADHWIADAYRKVALSKEESVPLKNFLDDYTHPVTALPLADYDIIVSSLQKAMGNQNEADINFAQENSSVIKGVEILAKQIGLDKLLNVNYLQGSQKKDPNQTQQKYLESVNKGSPEYVTSAAPAELSQVGATPKIDSFRRELKEKASSSDLPNGVALGLNSSLESTPAAKLSSGVLIEKLAEHKNYKIMVGIIVLVLAAFFLLKRFESK